MNLLHYGLQRSGTNYLEKLLKNNYRVRFLNSNKDRSSPLQKHCRLYDNKTMIPEPQYHNDIVVENFEQFEALFKSPPDYYLVVSKDPYSWYLSYKAWAQKCKWPDVRHHYIEEYNLFYGKFLELSSQTDKFIFIRYADLVKDANAVLNQLEKNMNLKKRLLARIIFKSPTKVSQSSGFTDDRRNYYTEQKFLSKYNEKELELLNSLIDSQVINRLGYKRVDAAK